MDKDTFNSLIQQIGQCDDDVERRELLTSLADDTNPMFDRVTDLEQQNTQLTDDNETLRSANMKLFLRVGDKSKPEEPPGLEPEPPKRKFDDLFNDQGGIK